MTILLAILALSFLIVVHELGHFTVAKLSNIKVQEFSLFMGPKLFSTQRGETTYSLRAIPLGGYVRMEGEEQTSEDSRAFNKKPVLIRMAVIAAGPIMNILVAFLLIFIFTSINGYNSTLIGPMPSNSPAYEAGIREGDRVIQYGTKSIINPMDVDLFLFGTKGAPVDVVVKRNGKEMPFHVTPEILQKNRYLVGFGPAGNVGIESRTVKTISDKSPAYKAGLREKDIILQINGKSVGDGRDIREFLKTSLDKPIALTIERNGQTLTLNKYIPLRDNNNEQYESGMYFQHLKGGIVDNVVQSANFSYSIARNVVYSLTWLISGKVSLSQMSGPVGIVTTIGDVVQASPTLMDKVLSLMGLTAFISINLGLMNLVPFPALDGSKLIILIIEAVRRKAIPPEREAMISLVGFVLLIMLMLFTTFHDVLRISGKG